MPPKYKLSPAFIAMMLDNNRKDAPPTPTPSGDAVRPADASPGPPEPHFTPLEEILGEQPTAALTPTPAPTLRTRLEPQLNLPTIGDVWQRMQADKRRTAAAYGPSDEWEPERDIIFPPLPGYPPRDGLLGRVGAHANGASMRSIGPNPEQPNSFGVTRPTPTPFVERPGIGGGFATDDNRTKAAMSTQVDPQFRADHEGFRQLIGDGRLNPAEQQRVSAIIDRVNAYRLGSQQGPAGGDAHSAAASDLGRAAGRLAQESPRVAAPLATYAMVHNQAAQRRADAGGAASMNSYGNASGQTAPAVNTAPPRAPYDFSSGFPSGKYDGLSKLGDIVPDAWSQEPAQRHVIGQGIQFAANQTPIDWTKAGFSQIETDPKNLSVMPGIGVGSGFYIDEKNKLSRPWALPWLSRTSAQMSVPARDLYSVDNLKLGQNDVLRPIISAAGVKHGWPPQTAAAIIDAEARKGGDGVWDPNSRSTESRARGLTQFEPETWIGDAQRRGSYLNGRASELGWLDKNGRIAPAHRREFLDLRYNATDSINAALDAASYNIEDLRRRGLILDNSPAALARYAYIAHHEGAAGAAAYLRGGPLHLSEDHWGNVPKKEQARYLKANGNDRSAAYRAFMNDYIDGHIDLRHFMVDQSGVEMPPTSTLYAAPVARVRLPDRPPAPRSNARPPVPMLRGRPRTPALRVR